ncbi:hypothetical protein JCM1841_007049 [Sporobolomyces salmonicolor]
MILPPPVPAPVAFYQLLQDPSNSHTRDLADAGAARTRVRAALRATRKDALAAGKGADWVGAARAISEYLPYLYAIMASVEADGLLLRTDPVFTWKSSLSSQSLKKGRNRIALPSLHFELTATLLSHAICLSNASATLVASLGSYEIASSVSSSSIKVHDETVNQAAEMLCRASGVLTHLAEIVIPGWEATVGQESLRARPIEVTRDAAIALAKMCLADANLLAIRRLLSRSLSVAHSTTTPGPPLPPSHPSPSLLAKLHLQVHTLYDEARSLFKSPSPSSTGEITPLLRRYLSDGRQLALALAYKWLGVDAGEHSATGDAIGWLGAAGKALDELKEKDKGIGRLKIGKGRKAAEGRKGKVQEEVESVLAFTNAYTKVNDTVHFQPIPSTQTLQSRLPSGRAALTPKAYAPPPPAFRTRLAAGAPQPKVPPPPPGAALAGLSLADDDSSDDSDGGAEVGDYFGAGQYF